jgi:hypothetical protein
MRRFAQKGLIVACAGLILASCATVPERRQAEWLGVLPRDATLYASLGVTGSAAFLKKQIAAAGPGLQDVNSLIDMTRRLVLSITITRGVPTQFAVVALGGYPSGIVGMRLSGNKDWKQQSSPAGTYWQWKKTDLQMSIPIDGILLAANGGVEPLLTRWKSPLPLAVPPDVVDDMEKADAVVYMPELPGGIAESAAQKGMRIPIKEVWLKAVKTQAGYDVWGTANTGSEQEARLFTLVMRLGIVAWMKTQNVPNVSERLKSISVAPSGVQVKLAGLHVTEEEIVPLFTSLLSGLAPKEPGVAPAEHAPADQPPTDAAEAPAE